MSFCTAIPGELSALARHSVLLALDPGSQADITFDSDEFDAGVEVAAQHRAAAIMLFSARSRMLKRARSGARRHRSVSGLLIGVELRDLRGSSTYAAGSIAVVGEPDLPGTSPRPSGRLGAACRIRSASVPPSTGLPSVLGHRAAMRDVAVAS